MKLDLMLKKLILKEKGYMSESFQIAKNLTLTLTALGLQIHLRMGSSVPEK